MTKLLAKNHLTAGLILPVANSFMHLIINTYVFHCDTINEKGMFNMFLFGRRKKKEKNNVKKSKGNVAKNNSLDDVEIEISDEDLALIPKGYNPQIYMKLDRMIINSPAIQMKPGEFCFYQGNASAYKEVEKVVGYSGGSAGVSFRITKGVSVHTGSTAKKAIRKTVKDLSAGILYITNQRIMVLSPKYGFTVPIPQLAQIDCSIQNTLVLYKQNGQAHSVYSDDIDNVLYVLKLLSDLKKDG